MIEVEKKIVATSYLQDYLKQNGKLLSTETIQDTYFDALDYRYTLQNIWLRLRNGAYELKRALKKEGGCDCYEEITDLKRMLSILKIEERKDNFTSSIIGAQIFPFAAFSTVRESYSIEGLTLILDLANFSDFTYEIAEIESVVESQDEVAKAEQNIENFLSRFSIDQKKRAIPKLTMYLARSKPDHYKVLQKAGII